MRIKKISQIVTVTFASSMSGYSHAPRLDTLSYGLKAAGYYSLWWSLTTAPVCISFFFSMVFAI